MRIRHLTLRGFRNYSELDLTPGPRRNLVIGENAAGKTNILEAVFLMSHGRSHRARQDRELIGWQAEGAGITLDAESSVHGGGLKLEVRLAPTATGALRAVFRQDGLPLKARSELIGKLPTVSFFASDLLLLRGTPEDRRTALDQALVQYDPPHIKRLVAYNRIRQQKAQWLKLLPEAQDPAVKESLDAQLAEAGSFVLYSRLQYLARLEASAQPAYRDLAEGREALTILYATGWASDLSAEMNEAALRGRLLNAIQAANVDERRRGQVLVGPHRDDTRFFLDGRDACLYASQGQQRSIVLATKLSEMRHLTERLGAETPILLLDDVMAELDPHRQHRLLAQVAAPMQVLLTTTHLEGGVRGWLGAEDVCVFKVRSGQVTPMSAGDAVMETLP